MLSRRSAVVLVGLAAAYWIGLFVLTHIRTAAALPTGARGSDKFVHFAAYAVLAALVSAAASWWWRPGWKTAFAVIAVAAAYGALDEWSQRFVPPRTADPWDWAADVLGAAAGAIAFAVAYQVWTRASRSPLAA